MLPRSFATAVLLLFATSAFAFDTVIIDPGHGGKDPGSMGIGGIMEKNLALDLAKRMKKLFEEREIKVVLTRDGDTYPELAERASFANKYTNSIFISLHFNGHPDTKVSGLETFYMSPAGERLANFVHDRLIRRMNTKNRGVKKGNLKVLRDTRCTAILIEGGFLTNRWELQRCASGWYREVLAKEIVAGVMRYR